MEAIIGFRSSTVAVDHHKCIYSTIRPCLVQNMLLFRLDSTLITPHIRSRLRGAALMMLSTLSNSSAASDADETTALFSL